MLVSTVLVHYRTPRLAARAVAALREDCVQAGLDCEVVVVDNGSAPDEAALLREAADRVIEPGGNLGYAGGLNRGVAAARGNRLLLMNPDVIVLPGCVAGLVEALEGGAAAAGPRFYWDTERRLLIPPTEERSRRAALLGRLAPALATAACSARRRWRRNARRHWLATEPFDSVSLSGALLAIRREAWERAGPFDEGFHLYFEETDWLLRLARAGLTARYVPAAEAVHLYDQSAAAELRSRAWFAESRRRFESRHYGRGFAALLALADRCAGASRSGQDESSPLLAPVLALGVPEGAAAPLWVEVSPSPLGFPAAAEAVGEAAVVLPWSLPAEVWSRLRPGRYAVRVADARGAEGPARVLVKQGGEPGSATGP
jgi:GT2 family glycosyltransferase